MQQDFTTGYFEEERIGQERVRLALDAAGTGIWEFDPVCNTVAWDEQCCSLFGFAPHEEVTFKDVFRHVTPGDAERIREMLEQAMSGMGDSRIELRFQVPGAARWVLATGKVYFNEEGHAQRLAGIAQDITRSSFRQAARIPEVNMAAAALNNRSVGIFHIDLVTDSIEYSPAFAVILTGDERMQLTRADLISHIHPEDAASRKAAYEAAARSGDLHYEARTIWNDGSIHWVRTVGSYTFDEAGFPVAFTGTVQDITSETQARLDAEAARHLADMAISSAGIGMFRFDLVNGTTEYSPAFAAIFTGDPDKKGLTRRDFIARVHPDDEPLRAETMKNALLTGDIYYEPRVIWDDGSVHRIRVSGACLFDSSGRPTDLSGTAKDITELSEHADALRAAEQQFSLAREASEARFRSIVEQAPMAIGLLSGREMVIEVGNAKIFELWGKDPSITGMRVIDALPEIEGQGFMELLEEVYDTGNPYNGNGMLAKLVRNGRLENVYFDFTYAPLRDAAGAVTGVMVLAIDVTEQMHAFRAVEESEARFRSLIEEAPFATALYTGRDLIIETANEQMIQVWGKDKSVIGMPLSQALPELEGQPFLDILDEVYTTGVAYHTQEALVKLVVDGTLGSFYFNFTYKPLFNISGEVYAILNMAVEVTDQVLSRRKLEESEVALRGAIELAELGTWSMDAATGMFTFSERLQEWFGFREGETVYSTGYNPIHEKDRDSIEAALKRAFDPASGGFYDVEYTLVEYRTGRERICHAQGKAMFDEEGRPVRLSGTTQDVTEQRRAQLALEQLVQVRTEELTAANEELAETNARLLHSNEELAQYAYVASHDLQEPLRKIRMFSGLLESQQSLDIDSRRLVDKIAQSAGRMSLLISDLLEFSRLLKSESLVRPVDLKEVAAAVVNDFELVIAEKTAGVHIRNLPVIQAIGLQMNQLLYNLIGNALKFSKPDVPPEIRIEAEAISMDEAARYIQKPFGFAQYYRIAISDNGIGFEVRYAEQIFEVFKRLHGREVYPGSGIGLALCRRIVDNHNGSIRAESTPGKGTVFHVILPDKQREYDLLLPDQRVWSNE